MSIVYEQYRIERDERDAQAAREMEEARRENEEARERLLAKLQSEKAERQAIEDAELERSLAPEKERERRRWLADHPGKTAKDFDSHAWPQLRLNMIEDRRKAEMEALMMQKRQSGMYSL